jgi:hypothetical protein
MAVDAKLAPKPSALPAPAAQEPASADENGEEAVSEAPAKPAPETALQVRAAAVAEQLSDGELRANAPAQVNPAMAAALKGH